MMMSTLLFTFICILILHSIVCFRIASRCSYHSWYGRSLTTPSDSGIPDAQAYCGCDEVPIESNNQYSDKFIADITTDDVTSEELSDENIVQIVTLETSDEQANTLVWKCLGYRLVDKIINTYNNDRVFPKWKAKYPTPPDLIGVRRLYDPSIDKPVRDASMNLVRSIPRDYKGSIKSLQRVGYKGFKLSELTPNKTRRAQIVNWLIYYREYLHGKTLDQLVAERMNEKKSEEEMNLPSEVMFQQLRLDEATAPETK